LSTCLPVWTLVLRPRSKPDRICGWLYLECAGQLLRLPGAHCKLGVLDLHDVARLLARSTRGPILTNRIGQVHDIGVDVRLLDRQVFAAQIGLVAQLGQVLAPGAAGIGLGPDPTLHLEARRVAAGLIDVCDIEHTSRAVQRQAAPRRACAATAVGVIALGSVSNDSGIPDVRQYMGPFLATEDARDLQIAVSRSIQDAARIEFDEPQAEQDELGRRMTVLIGGAGATGVEVAASLVRFMEDQWQAAWRVAGDPEHYPLPKPRIILVGAAPTVLPGWPGQTGQAVADALQELDVELRLGLLITKVQPGRVQLKTGE